MRKGGEARRCSDMKREKERKREREEGWECDERVNEK